MQYSLNFQSSNETIMKHPTANIRLNGLVPRKTKGKTKQTSYAAESGRVMLHSYHDCNASGLTLQILHVAFKKILLVNF